jgi:arylsulfatase A-like enzyme
MTARPNILVFIPHDLGTFLHAYGHESVSSPHLDALAGRGVRFSNCFTTCPECTPSRGGLWTGLYPHQNGLMGLSNFGWELKAPHLAERLGREGYATHLFGLQHETDGDPHSLGYGQVHGGDASAVASCEALRRFLASDEASSGGPWFACAGFRDVHRPWNAPSGFRPEDVDVPPYLPDAPVIRSDLANFHQAILDMDAAVGSVLDALAGSALGRQTLVIFTTDHGAGFPRAKATLYDPGLRVPLIMHWPGVIEGGHVHDALVSNLDVSPTVLDLCGLPVPPELEGKSLTGLLSGGPACPERDAVFSELLYDVSYDPMHAVRTRKYKYIRSFGVRPEDAAGADRDVLCSFKAGQWVRVDDYDVMSSPSWRFMDHGDFDPPPVEELYDLDSDPGERMNLAARRGSSEGNGDVDGVLREMRRRLDEWMRRTRSPLLRGHVPPPEAQRAANRKYRPGGPMYGRR